MNTVRVPCATHGIMRDDPWHDVTADVPADAVMIVRVRRAGIPCPVSQAVALCGAFGDPDSIETARTGQLHSVRWTPSPVELAMLVSNGATRATRADVLLAQTLASPTDTGEDFATQALAELMDRGDAMEQLTMIRRAHAIALGDILGFFGLDHPHTATAAFSGMTFRQRLTALARTRGGAS